MSVSLLKPEWTYASLIQYMTSMADSERMRLLVKNGMEYMTLKDVAEILHKDKPKIVSMMLNGTMPVGGVAPGGKGENTVVVIITLRFIKWYLGEV